MQARAVLVPLVLLLQAAAGCIAPTTVSCADGRVCPAPKVCAPTGGCVSTDELYACAGHAEGESCTLSAGRGRCRQGRCVLGAGCGDGVLDEGELCDDGNRDSGDGCRADCLKLEVCGDGALDHGETCDDGNTNPVDACDACKATTWIARAAAGGKLLGVKAGLFFPYGVALDPLGNLYIADRDNHRVRRVDVTSGVISTVAGTGIAGFSGDGGAATSAQLNGPEGVVVDGLGNLYIADRFNHRIRRVDAVSGVISTVAGTGIVGYSGDGGAATAARFNFDAGGAGLTVDGLGNLYIADASNHCIRKVDGASGQVSTVAGVGALGSLGDGGPATSARLRFPVGVVADGAGSLYIADRDNHRIRRVDGLTGIMSTVAGTGVSGFSGDGGPATLAKLSYPHSVAFDATGRLYIADGDNNRIRRVDLASGLITTVVGTGTAGSLGNGGPASMAQLSGPNGVTVDGAGNLYIGDTGNEWIRRVDAVSGNISVVAGTGVQGYLGDGGAATSAVLGYPAGVATDAAGDVYIADTRNHRVRKVDAKTGVISTVAGIGSPGFVGDGASALGAQLQYPTGTAVDALGNVYIADSSNNRVRRVDALTGLVSTVAGNGLPCPSLVFSCPTGDGGPATEARLLLPNGVTLDAQGNLFIADSTNHRIRRVDLGTGVISSVAGSTQGFGGDGAPATSAKLLTPTAVVFDPDGNMYIVDSGNNRIRRVDAATGFISTVVGAGTYGYSGDGFPAASAQLAHPYGLAIDSAGQLYIGDSQNSRVRRVDLGSGLISTVVGTGVQGDAGDGGPATSATLSISSGSQLPSLGVAVDAAGGLYVVDNLTRRVRRVKAGVITPFAGQIAPEGMGPIADAYLANPRALVVAPGLSLVAGGSSGTVQAVRTASGTVAAVAGRYLQSVPTGELARFRDRNFGSIAGIAYDSQAGRIYLSETSAHRLHVVHMVDPADENSWTISQLAGDASGVGSAGFADGAAADARFSQPSGLYLDAAAQVLYVADTGNHVIRAVQLTAALSAATVTTVAGTPMVAGFLGDDEPASSARLSAPEAVTRCGNGDLFIADTGNQRVRRVAAGTGLISSVLGNGVAASSGQGLPANSFPVDKPRGLACDAIGNLFVTSRTTLRLLPATDAGLVDGSGPVQSIYGVPPRDSFPASVTDCLTGVALVDGKTVQVADSCTGVLVELERMALP